MINLRDWRGYWACVYFKPQALCILKHMWLFMIWQYRIKDFWRGLWRYQFWIPWHTVLNTTSRRLPRKETKCPVCCVVHSNTRNKTCLHVQHCTKWWFDPTWSTLHHSGIRTPGCWQNWRRCRGEPQREFHHWRDSNMKNASGKWSCQHWFAEEYGTT